MTSYRGDLISAFALQPCLTTGFHLASDVLVGDEPSHPTGLQADAFTCNEGGIEIAVFNDNIAPDELDYADLSDILAVISGFHQQYAMREVEFDVLSSRSAASVIVGHG